MLIDQYKDLLVLAKPPNLHSVSGKSAQEQSLAGWLIKNYPEQGQLEDGGLVHRLDFETSGLMIAARSQESWLNLRSSFSSESTRKKYLALVAGKPVGSQQIESWLGSRHRRSKKVSVFIDPPSDGTTRMVKRQTTLKLLHYYQDEKISLVEVTITRGMRHQIRAHLAHLGHALVGDSLYGSEFSLPKLPELEFRKFFLHSWKVELKNPADSRISTYTCEQYSEPATDLLK